MVWSEQESSRRVLPATGCNHRSRHLRRTAVAAPPGSAADLPYNNADNLYRHSAQDSRVRCNLRLAFPTLTDQPVERRQAFGLLSHRREAIFETRVTPSPNWHHAYEGC